jgi:SAM-dependent methyltransferase
MELKRLKRNWNSLGRRDPLWAVLALEDKRGNRWDDEEFFAWGRDEIEGALEYVRSIGMEIVSGRALDFGCGVGRLTQALAARFDEVHGVDIAPSMIRLAKRYNRYPESCRYHLNEQSDLRLFPDGTFDFIYTNITLQHMEPRYSKQYVREFVRLLSPQGVLVFQLPSERIEPPSVGGRDRLSGVRRIVKSITPGFLVPAVRWVVLRLRDLRKPSMEGHGVPQVEVINLLEKEGARVVDVQLDNWTPDWIAYRYCVTKAR